MTEVNLKSQISAKTVAEASSEAVAGTKETGVEVQRGHVSPRRRKKSDSKPGMGERSNDSHTSLARTQQQSPLSLTSQHCIPAVELTPPVTIKQEVKEEIKEEMEEEEPVDMLFVMDVCREAMGRGVVGIGEVKDRLLLRQLEPDPGREGQMGKGTSYRRGVSEALLERGLQLCGAVEVGMPSGKRLFALPLDDKVSVVLLILCA